MDANKRQAYWKKNTSLMVKLLIIWFIVSFGCGIILVDLLNTIQIGGYKLGFWFAQQGSIYVFMALILYYVVKMRSLERKYDLDD